MAAGATTTPRLSAGERWKRRVKTLGLRLLSASGATRLVDCRYGGRGVILMFHDFTRDPRRDLDQGCRIGDFERILRHLRRTGRDIVTLDEAQRRLADPSAGRFAVLTFDDGYRSNIELALPVMERYAAPATIYVPTAMVTREINAWWLGLTALFRDRELIDFEPMGVRWSCPDLDSKIAGLRRALAWVWGDFRRAETLGPTFAAHGISLPDLVERVALDEAGVIAADRHPLVEIGAHTTTHRALALLGDDEVRAELVDNKRFLEERLQREVAHFAYPYGPPSLSGEREPAIAREAGFRSAVTTDPGCLFPDHARRAFTLPRQNAEYTEDGAAYAACGAAGLFRALASRGGSPVAGLAGAAT
jgi:peptidoglycan/xylan/chitin deacetylase (PgdA/CDA1 family)